MARTIVCGTDFSPQAVAATQLACRLAKRLDAGVLLVHVCEPVVLAVPEAPAAVMALDEARRVNAHQSLKVAVAALANTGLHVDSELRLGVAHEELSKAAAGAHLLVVGTHGRAGASRVLLGSVAERVADHATVPVLVVPSVAGTPQPWLLEDRQPRLLLAVDGSQTTVAAVDFARALALELRCKVTAAHVYWPPVELARRGLPWSLEPETDSEDADVRRSLAHEVREELDPWPREVPLEVSVRASWATEGEALAEVARESAADVIVIGTHQRHGFKRWLRGSVSQGVLRHTKLPVLCVPTPSGPHAVPAVPPLMHVMVVADGTQASEHALARAIDLLALGGTLEVALTPGKADLEALENRVRTQLSEAVRNNHFRLQMQVPAADTLPQVAVRQGVQLVVVPAQRRGLFEEPAGRGIDDLVAAGCSVLVVPEPAL